MVDEGLVLGPPCQVAAIPGIFVELSMGMGDAGRCDSLAANGNLRGAQRQIPRLVEATWQMLAVVMCPGSAVTHSTSIDIEHCRRRP